MDRADRVAVARVGRPHGLGGELRLDPMGGLPSGLGGYRTLLLEQRDVFTPVVLEGERRNGRFLLVKFAGIDTPEQARAWTHATLWVPRDEMPSLAADEYYHVDLLGCRVEDEAGTLLGEVVDVVAGGAHDLLVVREAGREWMLPLLARWVPTVEVERRLVVVRLPEGLRE
ncbi:MAG: ribosome maturation factor RimM [Deferrisomatales bacterium]|nr:ribosome maturation factor RimM [Deferrisomatales bacterium]